MDEKKYEIKLLEYQTVHLDFGEDDIETMSIINEATLLLYGYEYSVFKRLDEEEKNQFIFDNNFENDIVYQLIGGEEYSNEIFFATTDEYEVLNESELA